MHALGIMTGEALRTVWDLRKKGACGIKFVRRKTKPPTRYVWSDDQQLSPNVIPSVYDEACSLVRTIWSNCDDVEFRDIRAGDTKVTIFWVGTLIDKLLVQTGIVEPLIRLKEPITGLETLEQQLPIPSYRQTDKLQELNQAVGSGMAAILVENGEQAVIIDVASFTERPIEKSDLEPSVIGPQAAFVENLQSNIALLRRRLSSPRVKMEFSTIGTISQTQVAMLYVDGVVKPEYVEETRKRLKRICIDGIFDANYVDELIKDEPYSLFPTVQSTERPDRVAAGLLEGRVSIMIDGTPLVILVPVSFFGLLQSDEDYYQNFITASAVRLLRHCAFWLSLLTPSLYVALLTYHQEMIPTVLLVTLVKSREGVPFPAFVEMLLMEFSFEILREAGVRLPRGIGQSVSIVGALVVGEAAVNAGIVSPLVVIVEALTGIASFSVPSFYLGSSVRFLRFPFVLLAGAFGLYGIVIAFLILLTLLRRPVFRPCSSRYRQRYERRVRARALVENENATPNVRARRCQTGTKQSGIGIRFKG
jgi:spore germination protein KA